MTEKRPMRSPWSVLFKKNPKTPNTDKKNKKRKRGIGEKEKELILRGVSGGTDRIKKPSPRAARTLSKRSVKGYFFCIAH